MAQRCVVFHLRDARSLPTLGNICHRPDLMADLENMVYPIRNERLAELQVTLGNEDVEVRVIDTRQVVVQFLFQRMSSTHEKDKR